MDVEPVATVLNTLVGFSGYLYPVENLTWTGELAYYRQREWRVTANMSYFGESVTQKIRDEEIETLIASDPKFFGRMQDFPNGKCLVARQCQFYRDVRGTLVHNLVRRLIVPEIAIDRAREILEHKDVVLEIATLESLAEQ